MILTVMLMSREVNQLNLIVVVVILASHICNVGNHRIQIKFALPSQHAPAHHTHLFIFEETAVACSIV